MNQRQTRAAQRGSVLIIGLIMLVVLTLLAVSAINMSTVSLRTVNGMQARGEAMSAAQRAIEQIINTNFAATMATVANTYTVAIDAGKSYDVVVPTPCLKQITAIRNDALDLTNAEDVKCYDTTTNPISACANTVWQFTASVNEGFFGANVTLFQGIALRMDNASATAYKVSTSPVYVCS
jgi:Tfp pilus assembly protein PilX